MLAEQRDDARRAGIGNASGGWGTAGGIVQRDRIVEIVLETLASANLGRTEQEQLEVSPTAPLFGAPSRLDSLGLVGLLIDIEEAVALEGVQVALSDERAVSQRHSPFRDVPSLVRYIDTLVNEATA
jgi:hypothetical protein